MWVATLCSEMESSEAIWRLVSSREFTEVLRLGLPRAWCGGSQYTSSTPVHENTVGFTAVHIK